ncbi:sulfite reductase flavoprotein subunit alpha [Novosphingobium aerophilum]|uniref:sulfite reductase flavoprotein subunit alpha n=1 Tax=Novosphingobium TaxID=165696 RepID=UPI002D77347A|nr:sulfite reductase flavoprotein subunit alpha [Novosphingobium sp. RL4]WRT94338.1 sulfite reductase flavoprotein subunit alpha [Novosphingobium sp. RL4]
MTRQVLFQIHWFLGITAGFVLALMGVTGATLSFENEIMRLLSPGIVTLSPGKGPALSPDEVIARASAQRAGLKVERLTAEHDPEAAWQVQFAAQGKERRGERSYVDPRSGILLGQPSGTGFFRTVEDLHRWLALPGGGNGIGRQITAFSAISLVFFAISGLYLRWPRRTFDWRAWLVLDLRKSGRNLYRALHAVIGGWVALVYLLSALTGLWWSYDWYRQGVLYALTGKTSREESGHGGGANGKEGAKEAAKETPVPSLARAWPTVLAAMDGRYRSISISMPEDGKETATFRVLLEDARHDRMTDDIKVDLADGKLVKADRYDRRSLGKVITTSMYELHRGAFFGIGGRILLLLTSLTMPLFTVTGLLLYLVRRRKKRSLREVVEAQPALSAATGDLLVAFASQTGGAERLARQTAAALGGARVVPLSAVDDALLSDVDRALFVVSTYGEGEPPDPARRFARQAMATPPGAEHLEYAVLALGDREYPEFCAFGHSVDRWLHAGGARRLFDMVEVNGEDIDAQRQWQQQLAALGAEPDMPDWEPAAYENWQLAERRLLNPGSAGGPAFLVSIRPATGPMPSWQAGDIAEVLPGANDPARIAAYLSACGLGRDVEVEGKSLADHLSRALIPDHLVESAGELVAALRPLPHREYSIASVPGDGSLDLLVRQVERTDGTLGLGSGWLTHFASPGGAVSLRLRANEGFHAPAGGRRLILIGNGTGLAGLRGHLRQSRAEGRGGHWLLFGERSRAHDALLPGEVDGWLADGTLTRLDRAWSRDADCGRYVQHLLAEAEADLRDWVENGAAILVCGSLQGMAPAVDDALRRALGDERVEAMAEAGLYRRDIY